jgi:hypothetical protein
MKRGYGGGGRGVAAPIFAGFALNRFSLQIEGVAHAWVGG